MITTVQILRVLSYTKKLRKMSNTSDRVELQVRNSAFNRRIYTFAIINKDHIDIRAFLNDAFHIYKSELSQILEEHHIVKTNTKFGAEFEKKIIENRESDNAGDGDNSNSNNNNSEQTMKRTLYISTPNKVVGLETDVDEHYQTNIVNEIVKSVENAELNGSGLALNRIIELHVQICSYEPLSGSSYIETPKKIKLKKAVVNVQNNDQMCFKWAILSALHSVDVNSHDSAHYSRYKDELNFDGIDFPVRLNQIDKFTKQNSTISVNVYFYDDDEGCVSPLRVSTEIRENHIHLLLIIDNSANNVYGGTTASKIKASLADGLIRTHYCWIKNFSRLVSSQLSKHNGKKYICDRCLNYFDRMEKLTKHRENCINECRIEMPDESNKWLKFENYRNQLKAPFIVYADTEAFLKHLNEEEQKDVFSDKCETSAYQQHNVYSVGYYFKCDFDDSKSYYASSKNSVNCIDWFMQELEKVAQFVAFELAKSESMNELNSDQKRILQDPNAKCSICDENFKLNEVRVRDHCHFTGKYRGVAHAHCNLLYQDSRTVPVVMHNLSGYDAHLFIRKLASQIRGDISIIPVNAEEYISFTKVVENSTPGFDYKEKIKLKFIDSFRFMPESLAKLASLIPTKEKRILLSECAKKKYTSEQIAMLERKCVYPYDYVDSFERLAETILPSKDHFKNKLNNADISDVDYEFAWTVWRNFSMNTLGDYSELYMKTDILLLADVFENFRNTCHRIYKLDPAHYYTAPGLSFDAMLKLTRIQIELLTDVEMLTFVERGIRGGISQCSKRHIKANNKYMKAAYKSNEETSYLMYLDGEFLILPARSFNHSLIH